MELVEIIYSKLSDYQSYKDLYDSCRAIREENPELFLEYMKKLNERIKEKLVESEDEGEIINLYGLHRDVLTTLGAYDFESYIYAMEWNRPLDKQFYHYRD